MQQMLDHPNSIEAPQLKRVSVDSLKDAYYNPSERISKRNLSDLVESLSKYGQLMPITITKENVIIEGHRRRAAAQLLGWSTLWAIVRPNDDKEKIYAEINGTSKKMTGNDSLGIWLKNADAVPVRTANFFANMMAMIGRDLVVRMHKEGYSLRLFRLARHIAKYVDRDTPDFTAEILEWLMEKRTAGIVSKLLTACEPPITFVNAIKKGRSLRLKASLVDD